MTLEQALIYGIGGLSTALTWAVTKLWAKSEECDADRRALRHAIEDLRAEHGLAKGGWNHLRDALTRTVHSQINYEHHHIYHGPLG